MNLLMSDMGEFQTRDSYGFCIEVLVADSEALLTRVEV